jgi:hypothetical protein
MVELTSVLDDGIVVQGRVPPEEVCVRTLLVPVPLREKLGDAASDGLVMMFAEAYRIGTEQLDRRIAEVAAKLDRKLDEEMSKLRLEMAAMKLDLLKWNFVFWIGQLAAMTAILSLMLRGGG